MSAKKQVGRSQAKQTRKRVKIPERWELSNAIDDRLGWMPHPEHRVLRILFRHANRNAREAWPGQTKIAKSCGSDRANVSRWLGRLANWGVIDIVRHGHKGSRLASVYRIRKPSDWPTQKPAD